MACHESDARTESRLHIDAALDAAGWILQNRDAINLAAGPGVAVREAKMASGHGVADDLPFVYMSTGVETRFIRPETLAEWIGAETLDAWVKRLHAEGSGL